MAIKFYNTLTRKKEVFEPIDPKKVGVYGCGPTVYNYVHLGNLRAYIFYDLIVRYLRYKGYNVVFVSNITDVDDKTIKGSQKNNISLQEFTEKYTKEYLSDLKALNITIPDFMPKATKYIKEMVDIIKDLVKKGYAYEKDGSYYFKVSKFKKYGKLANLENIDDKNLKSNAKGRLSDEYTKDDIRDFALWKAYDSEDGEVFWETDIGKGRPGWHIECSAMSTKILGCPIDIHIGGVDLIFPHHTNEIAQTECALGCKFVNYWMHNEHLMVNGEKMSKSLGNFYTLKDLMKKGYEPKAIRYQLLAAHYRQQFNFTEKSLEQIPNTLNKFYEFLDKLDEAKGEDNAEVDGIITDAKTKFDKSLDDDLNISGAIAAIFDMMHEINKMMDKNQISKKNAKDIRHLMDNFDKVLGIFEHEKEKIPKEIRDIALQREETRKGKNFKEADRLRDLLKEKGYYVDDKASNFRVKKID